MFYKRTDERAALIHTSFHISVLLYSLTLWFVLKANTALAVCRVRSYLIQKKGLRCPGPDFTNIKNFKFPTFSCENIKCHPEISHVCCSSQDAAHLLQAFVGEDDIEEQNRQHFSLIFFFGHLLDGTRFVH